MLELVSGQEQEVELVLGRTMAMLEGLQYDEEHCLRSRIGL